MTPAPMRDSGAVVAVLQRLAPPTAVVHVGVGRGTGAMHQWRDWNVAAAWLVDAEPSQLGWAEALAAAHPGWQACAATVAELDGRAPYYLASNPAESGLMPVGKLAALWPNLREKEREERTTTRLDTLLADTGALPADGACWLIVDCLPALRILQGAAGTLERCSVLWLRALLQPLPDAEPGTTLEELGAFLAPLGFRCLQASEGNHPALGDTMFVRDWAQRLQPVIAELRASEAQQRQLNQELAGRLAAQETAAQALAADRDAQAARATERQAQHDLLSREKAELAGKLDAESTRLEELTARLAQLEADQAATGAALTAAQADLATRTGERDAQAKLASERQAKLDALAKEKTDLQAKFEAATRANAELADKFSALEKQGAATADALKAAQSDLATRTGERDAQAKLSSERQAKLDALAKEKADLQAKLEAAAKSQADLADKLATLEKQGVTTADALKAAQSELATRTGERDAQVKLAGERQVQLDAQGKEKTALADELANARAAKLDLSKRIETLQGQVDALTKERDKVAKEHQSCKSELQARDAAIAKLNERIAEQDERERQLVEEIVRAEAQIDLIKDLLLREGGL